MFVLMIRLESEVVINESEPAKLVQIYVDTGIAKQQIRNGLKNRIYHLYNNVLWNVRQFAHRLKVYLHTRVLLFHNQILTLVYVVSESKCLL